MRYAAAQRSGRPRGTGLILADTEDFARLTEVAPVAPHFGDIVSGTPGAVEDTAAALAAGLAQLGIEFVVPEDYRLPQLNCVTIPAGVDDAALRKQLLQDYQLEIGAGLGPLAGKVWRIGLMGYASNQKNVLLCLGALDAVLSQQGSMIDNGAAVAAAQAVYG